jgi:Rieske Fe-S protein
MTPLHPECCEATERNAVAQRSGSVSRRTALVGTGVAGVALLAGCSTYGGETETPAPATAPGGGNVDAGKEIAQVQDVPVNGGKVIGNIVVTQPAPGEFKAFSAVCTHQGCKVARVGRETIDCLCHGSKFGVTDGQPKGGPATKPLPPVAVVVEGTAIRLA